MSRAKDQKVEDLNLIPLMNLFVTMIPLLLLTAAFYHIGMVSVSVPTQSSGDSSVETGKASVTVNVQVEPKGLTISATSGTIDPAELKALGAFIPAKGAKQDRAALTAALERIKRKYEQSNTMMLVPSKTTKYNSMIKLMDAARTMKASVGGRMRKLPLFPVVVVTSLVQ